MRTRFATPDDAAAIGRIHTVAWQVGYEHVFGAENLATIDQAGRTARWRERLEGGGDDWSYDVLVVEDAAGAVVGWSTSGAARDVDDAAADGELHGIYVDPAAWGTGAARELLRATVERLRGHGFREATLWVLDDNPRARRFYAREGWRLDEGSVKEDEFFDVRVREVRYRITL
jgi:GNAT superfamily N-acetyltransferase